MLSDYRPPLFYRNAHLSTIIPNRLRSVKLPQPSRITIDTPDDDFVDLDFFTQGNQHAVILLHGLEGNSSSSYMLGMTKTLLAEGMDVVCMNQRGCSGRPNRCYRSYHSGNSEDLKHVLARIDGYNSLSLIGFSLGGNIVLKYLSEPDVDRRIQSAMAISAPVHLESSAIELHKGHNRVYLTRFIKQLKRKALAKTAQFPAYADQATVIQRARNFFDFDNAYTAPAHGFTDATDYYQKASSIYSLASISTPSLIINALNDSFLSDKCFPHQLVEENPALTMLVPTFGGHVGFAADHLMRQTFWHEKKAVSFIKTYLN